MTRLPALDWRRAGRLRACRRCSRSPCDEAAAGLRAGTLDVIDLRASMTYRKGHIARARWAIEAGARGRAASRRDGCARGRRAGIGGARRDRSRRRRGARRSPDRGWAIGRGARPACRSRLRRIALPMPTASISCSSPTAATTATPRRRGNIWPGKPAFSVSSTPRSAACSVVAAVPASISP